MGEVHRLAAPEPSFGLQAAGRLMNQGIRALGAGSRFAGGKRGGGSPARRLPDWQPGAVLRLPFSKKNCCDGDVVCSQALMALADTAMVIACSAAWNGYRPMSTIDQTTHFLRPVNFDVVADARVVRIGRNTASAVSWCLRRRQAAGRNGRERLFDVVRHRHLARRRRVPVAGMCDLAVPRFQLPARASKLTRSRWGGRLGAMRRNLSVLVALAVVAVLCAGGAALAGANFVGPGSGHNRQ